MVAMPTDPRFIDLTGRTFGLLTVAEYVGKRGRVHCWLCRCQCGNSSVVRGPNLVSDRGTRSCGCEWRVRRPRPINLNGDGTATVPLTRGMVAVIDEADAERVGMYSWHARKSNQTHYATTTVYEGGVRLNIHMHQLVMSVGPESLVDHHDGNGLNNRRGNLRVCNQSQNLGNRRKFAGTSRFKGVSWSSSKGKWRANVKSRVKGVNMHLGYFDVEEDAARAYDNAARSLWGEFARLNLAS